MELGNFNLNLLVHLDALLAQRGVSGAAERLNLSQPTMSSALARSRRHFGDDLLRRRGVQRAFMMRPPEFDPSTSRREFVVAAAVNATYLGERLPNTSVDFIAGAGHFLWEERPDDYESLVTDWWDRTSQPRATE